MHSQPGSAGGEPGGPYHPPRASSGSRTRGWLYAARRRFPRSAGPLQVSFGRVTEAAAFIVPGLGLKLLGMPRAAAAIAGLCLLALLLAVAGIGAAWALLPVGALISAHSFGVSLFVANRWPDLSLGRRVFMNVLLAAAAFSTLPALIAALISPFVVLAGDRENVYLVKTFRPSRDPVPGEQLLAMLPGFSNGMGFELRQGNYLVHVVLVGEGVHWIAEGLSTRSDLPEFGTSGNVQKLVLGPDQFFAWPVNLRRLASQRLPLVAQPFVLDRGTILGRPYKRWFWRTFEYEPLPQS